MHATFRQLRNGRFSPNLVTKRSSVSRRWIRNEIFGNFYFRGHFPPKSEIERLSNRHLISEQAIQVTGCIKIAERYCLLHVVVQRQRVSEIGQLFSTTYGCGAIRGVKFAQFSDFGQFSSYKNPNKTYFPVTSLQPRCYIAEWLRFFHVVVEGLKGCLPQRSFPATSGSEAAGPSPSLP